MIARRIDVGLAHSRTISVAYQRCTAGQMSLQKKKTQVYHDKLAGTLQLPTIFANS